jgi:hypothetical protein
MQTDLAHVYDILLTARRALDEVCEAVRAGRMRLDPEEIAMVRASAASLVMVLQRLEHPSDTDA